MSHPSSTRGRQVSDDDEVAVDPSRIRVGVGELAVATNGETLTTSGLGSCVAVGLVDRDAGVRGLLHAMLPNEGDARSATARPAKYVDTGIEALIEALRESGASSGRLEARVAGGAEMLDLTDAVGPRNVERAEESLSAAGVPIVASDVGDGVGRTVRLRADGGLVVRAADGFERTL
ncbi:chemotaxis protein CheD [Halorubrum laminariae]|uniref:Probable chemoreceptor glutamine deamidase CheD n=1 Tax=Halorubrum laminariae TaxID=1433523 RepID=A0ABD6C0R5_9EURY|nr:chemotaxis protein CheD [Halorubrum laminariae]